MVRTHSLSLSPQDFVQLRIIGVFTGFNFFLEEGWCQGAGGGGGGGGGGG